jgi:hypothetical protein
MQPQYRTTGFRTPEAERRHAYRPQPLEPVQRAKPWVVPVALAMLIVVLLVALVALAQQVPASSDPVRNTTTSTTLFGIDP